VNQHFDVHSTQYPILINLENPLIPKFSKNILLLLASDEPLRPVTPDSYVSYQQDGRIALDVIP